MPLTIVEASTISAAYQAGWVYHVWETKGDHRTKLLFACATRADAEELVRKLSPDLRVSISKLQRGQHFRINDELYVIAADQSGVAESHVRTIGLTSGATHTFLAGTMVLPVRTKIECV